MKTRQESAKSVSRESFYTILSLMNKVVNDDCRRLTDGYSDDYTIVCFSFYYLHSLHT